MRPEDIPCPICGAPAGECCVVVPVSRRREVWPRILPHVERADAVAHIVATDYQKE
jgi:hypothetical protein